MFIPTHFVHRFTKLRDRCITNKTGNSTIAATEHRHHDFLRYRNTLTYLLTYLMKTYHFVQRDSFDTCDHA